MSRGVGSLAATIVLVAACGGSEAPRGADDAGAASPPHGDAGAPTPTPYPTRLPPPNTPCVSTGNFGSSPSRADAAPPCFTCSCDPTYEAVSPPKFAWSCSAEDCPDLCPAKALPPGSSEPCDTAYKTGCHYDIDRCSEDCTCVGGPPPPPGFIALQMSWLCIAECTGCPAGPPPNGAQCWGEPDPCTYGSGCAAVTCTCDVFHGEDIAYHGGEWRCASACVDGGR